MLVFLQQVAAVGMATIDGRPAMYGVTLKQLRDLMENRGREGVEKLTESGGIQDLCKKLYTSPSEGNFLIIIPKSVKTRDLLN
jgi:hypothetical protein